MGQYLHGRVGAGVADRSDLAGGSRNNLGANGLSYINIIQNNAGVIDFTFKKSK